MSTLSRKVLSGTGRAGGSFIVAAGQSQVTSGLYVYDHRNPGNISVADSNTDRAYQAAAFRPDGKYIAAGTTIVDSPNLYIFDFTSFTSLSIADTIDLAGPALRPKRPINRLHWSPDGNYLAVAVGADADPSIDDLFLIDCTDPTNISISDSVKIGARDVRFTPDGKYLVVGGSATSGITLYDVSTPGTLAVADVYEDSSQTRVSVNFDGSRIAVSGGDKIVYLLDHSTPGTLSLISTYTTDLDVFHDLAFTATGDQIMCVGQKSTELTRELLNIAPNGTMTLEQKYSRVGNTITYAVDFSPDGLQVVFGDASAGVQLLDFSPPNSLTATDSDSDPGQTFDVSFSLV